MYVYRNLLAINADISIINQLVDVAEDTLPDDLRRSWLSCPLDYCYSVVSLVI